MSAFIFSPQAIAASRGVLTPTQERVLQFIRDFRHENGYAPTRTEIAHYFNWSSANAAEDVIRALDRKGHLIVTRGIARGLVPA